MFKEKLSSLKKKKFFKAFTLIELIIIVSIIIILGLVAYTQLEQRGPARARDSKRVAELNSLRDALQLYYMDHGRFPTSTDAEEEEGKGECYIGAPPGDPHHCPYLESELVPDYIKDLPTDPLNDPNRGLVYIYKSTSSGSGYTLQANLETREPFVISSTGGFAMTGGGSGGGSSAVCGNGIVEGEEDCDDGNADPDDTYYTENPGDDDGSCVIDQEHLENSCKNNICGDGYLNLAIEECDDGNNILGDGCDATCHIESSNPVAGDDKANTDLETSVNINVIANDSDPDGSIDPTTVNIQNPPSNGSATPLPSGEVQYVPNPGYLGSDTFTYTVNDNDGNTSNPATVTVDVNCFCGMHITGDTILNCDITGCAGTIIYIDAPNITLDCAGHYLQSTGDEGIKNFRHDGVTVKNCYIDMNGADGDKAIALDHVDNGFIQDNIINVTDMYGIYWLGGHNVTISGNVISSNKQGIFYTCGSHISITDNTVTANDLAIYTPSGSSLHIEYNTATVNLGKTAILTRSGTIANNKIRGIINANTFGNIVISDNDIEGKIKLSDTTNDTITRNIIHPSSPPAIILDGTFGSVSDNKIYDNSINSNTPVVQWISGASSNDWNVDPPQGGPNIIGGNMIGGNYWTNSSKTGYSDTCADTNDDGFCDSPYDVEHNDSDCSDTNNCDNYPLAP